MTTPVTTAAPTARTAPASDAGGTDSAEPFASALDGALGAVRSEADGAGAQAGGDPAGDQEEAAAEGATGTPAEVAATAPGGVVAALWSLLTGAAKGAAAADGDTTGAAGKGTPVAAGHVDGLPPGLAVAKAARAAGGVAHGLHGTQPGQLAKEARAAVDGAIAEGTTPVPAAAAATPPPAAVAAARAALEALAAAGVQGVAVEAPDTSTTAQPVLPAVAATGVATDGESAQAAGPTQPVSLPVAPEAAPTGGGTADTGSRSGSDTGDDGSARTDAVPTTGQAAPAGSTAPVARTEATGTAAAQPVSGQIAKQVAVLRGGPDGSHTMTVVLTPDTLGPVEVSVTVSQGTLEMTLRGAHEHGRAALLDALPDLRRDLESAGLTCSRLDVDRGSRDGAWSSSQQNAGRPGDQGPGGRGSQHDRSEAGARPWQRSADTGEGPRATTRTASGLDVRV